MQARSERPGASLLSFVCASLLTVLPLLTGCFGVTSGTSGDFTALAAASASIRVNEQMQITAPGNAGHVALTYVVNGVSGGNAQVGTISESGVYTAPAIVPVPNTVTITSTAPLYPSHAGGTLTLSILNPIPVVSSVTPSGFAEGTATVTVNGSEFVYGAQIVWNGSPVATTFVSGNELAAAISAGSPGTYPLTVLSLIHI